MKKQIGPYILKEEIGKGQFGVVYKGVNQLTKAVVAIKMISRKQKGVKDEAIRKEIELLKKFKHPNIIQLLDTQKTDNNYYLVMEFCPYGNLEGFIKEHYGGKVDEQIAQGLFYQVVEGYKEVLKSKVIHRDIKLSNFLVGTSFLVKVSDFGLAREMNSPDDMMQSVVGTPITMAPEIRLNKSYHQNSDIWSLGFILYQLLTGEFPFDLKQIPNFANLAPDEKLREYAKLSSHTEIKFNPALNLSESVKSLLKGMLCPADKRIDFQQLFDHEFLKNVAQKFVLTTANCLQNSFIQKHQTGGPGEEGQEGGEESKNDEHPAQFKSMKSTVEEKVKPQTGGAQGHHPQPSPRAGAHLNNGEMVLVYVLKKATNLLKGYVLRIEDEVVKGEKLTVRLRENTRLQYECLVNMTLTKWILDLYNLPFAILVSTGGDQPESTTTINVEKNVALMLKYDPGLRESLNFLETKFSELVGRVQTAFAEGVMNGVQEAHYKTQLLHYLLQLGEDAGFDDYLCNKQRALPFYEMCQGLYSIINFEPFDGRRLLVRVEGNHGNFDPVRLQTELTAINEDQIKAKLIEDQVHEFGNITVEIAEIHTDKKEDNAAELVRVNYVNELGSLMKKVAERVELLRDQ